VTGFRLVILQCFREDRGGFLGQDPGQVVDRSPAREGRFFLLPGTGSYDEQGEEEEKRARTTPRSHKHVRFSLRTFMKNPG
jgi:hypothetical protein